MRGKPDEPVYFSKSILALKQSQDHINDNKYRSETELSIPKENTVMTHETVYNLVVRLPSMLPSALKLVCKRADEELCTF